MPQHPDAPQQRELRRQECARCLRSQDDPLLLRDRRRSQACARWRRRPQQSRQLAPLWSRAARRLASAPPRRAEDSPGFRRLRRGTGRQRAAGHPATSLLSLLSSCGTPKPPSAARLPERLTARESCRPSALIEHWEAKEWVTPRADASRDRASSSWIGELRWRPLAERRQTPSKPRGASEGLLRTSQGDASPRRSWRILMLRPRSPPPRGRPQGPRERRWKPPRARGRWREREKGGFLRGLQENGGCAPGAGGRRGCPCALAGR
eukprot:scaffold123633_cov31-Tisochrysis_lutea.AAC.4